MNHVFISYAREDTERARQLATALQSSRVPVWWDEAIQVGHAFPDAIYKAINEARVVVVLWSRISVRSEWVKREAQQALQTRKFYPALLDPVDPPSVFAKIHCADLRRWRIGFVDPGFDKLMMDLRSLTGQQGKGNWQVKAVSPTKLVVRLDHQTHTVEFFKGHAHIDGRQLPFLPNTNDIERSFPFTLRDGNQPYPAELRVTVSIFRGNAKRMSLSVAGRTLYSANC